jgi:hypothetical protein
MFVRTGEVDRQSRMTERPGTIGEACLKFGHHLRCRASSGDELVIASLRVPKTSARNLRKQIRLPRQQQDQAWEIVFVDAKQATQ